MAPDTRRTGRGEHPATAPQTPFRRWEERRRAAAEEAELPSSPEKRDDSGLVSPESGGVVLEPLELDHPGELSLPPGSRRPAVMQSTSWVRRPVEFMERSRRKFGPCFHARLGPLRHVVFLSDPAYVKAVLSGDPDLLRTGDINGIFRPIIGSNSILVLDGKRHLDQRRLLLPAFHGDSLATFRTVMTDVTERELVRWPAGEEFQILPRMHSISTEVVLHAVLGIREGERRDRLRELLPRFLDLSQSTAVFMPFLRVQMGGHSSWAKLMRTIRQLDDELFDEIGARREQVSEDEPARDVLSMLVQARHEDGTPIGDQELRDELITLLVAGHETTSGALALAIEEIVRHPGVVQGIRSENGSGDESYSDAVVMEALRKRPVLPIVGRKLSQDVRLGAYVLPQGAVVMPCPYLLHHEESIYPEPHEFRPERFLENPPGTYTWIPFGGGVRRCVGASFAQLQMKVVLKTLFERLDLWPARGPERIRRRSVSLAPAHGGAVIAQPRRR
jgi:cytochrome P450 family 135